jgi:hypothetical protein
MSPSPHLRSETHPVSETLCFLVFRIPDNKVQKPSDSEDQFRCFPHMELACTPTGCLPIIRAAASDAEEATSCNRSALVTSAREVPASNLSHNTVYATEICVGLLQRNIGMKSV